MNRDLKAASFRSPWGFNTNSRGCSPHGIGTEPVVWGHKNINRPCRGRKGSSGILPESEGVQYKQDTPVVLTYSTPTGKHSSFERSRRDLFKQCSQRNITPNLIRIIPPENQSTQAGCLSYPGGCDG
jgi:hypothetical protein